MQGHDAIYVGTTGDASYFSALDGPYFWVDPNLVERGYTPQGWISETCGYLRREAASNRIVAVSVWPGFNDTGVWGWDTKPRTMGRAGGRLYNATWDAAVKCRVPWVIVTRAQ